MMYQQLVHVVFISHVLDDDWSRKGNNATVCLVLWFRVIPPIRILPRNTRQVHRLVYSLCNDRNGIRLLTIIQVIPFKNICLNTFKYSRQKYTNFMLERIK